MACPALKIRSGAATAGAVETRRGGDGTPAMAWWRFPPLQPPSLIGLGF